MSRRLNIISQRLAFLIPMVISLFVALKFLYNADIRVLGNDTMAHIYKVWLLSNQIRTLNWSYWGLWDTNWYGGYPYLIVYGPLFYYISALTSLILNFSAADAVKLVTIITFPLSALAMYFFLYSILSDRFISVVGSITYSLVPTRITPLTITGNPTYTLTFVFIPLVFLFVHRILKGDRADDFNLTLASLFLSAITLSHHGIGAGVTAFLLIFLILYFALLKRIKVKALLIIPVSLLISAFFIVPSIEYMLTTSYTSLPLSRRPVGLLYMLWAAFFPISPLSIGITSITFLVTFGMLMTYSLLVKKKVHNIILVYWLCALILIMCVYLTQIPPLVNVLFLSALSRAIVLIPFFSSFIISYYFSIIKTRLKPIIAIVLIIVLMFETGSAFIYKPVEVAERYAEAYSCISEFDSFGEGLARVFQIPRHPVTPGVISMQYGRPVIDGVYDEGAPKGVYYFIVKMISFAGGEGIDGWGDFVHNVDAALGALRVLGVKYLIVDASDPVFPADISKAIYLNVRNSKLVYRVVCRSESKGIFIFSLKEWHPIIVAPVAFQIDDKDEIKRFYNIVSSSEFDPSKAIFLSKDNYVKDVPIRIWSNELNLNVEPLNPIVYSIDTDDLMVKILLEVDRPGFLYVPISYGSNLKVLVNGKQAVPLKALPDFVSIYLHSSGVYEVVFSRERTQLEVISMLISLTTLCGLLLMNLYTTVLKRESRREQG